MNKLLIFDMDGTIADTSEGIYESYKHVAKVMNRPLPDDETLSGVIGGSLPFNLKNIYKLNDDEVEKAVRIYREFYADEGFRKSKLYDGFKESIVALNEKGYKLAVATLKAEIFAVKLLEMWGISDYFTCIFGVDEKDTISKEDMIEKCIKTTNIPRMNTFMIGDSPKDKDAADKCKINFLAVTYGFQYTIKKCVENHIPFVKDCQTLIEYFGME